MSFSLGTWKISSASQDVTVKVVSPKIFISWMQTSKQNHIIYAKLKIDSHHKCKLKYGFISKMHKSNKDWCHECEFKRGLISRENLYTDSYHNCKLDYGSISLVQTPKIIHTSDANSNINSYHECTLKHKFVSLM